MKNKVEVFIADDKRLMREGLALLLNGESAIRVVGEAFRCDEIQNGIEALKPDILLLDMALVESGEVPSIEGLHSFSPQTRIIMLSSESRDEHVHFALNEGALGFIAKQSPSSEIINAINLVMNGHYFLSPPIMNRVIETYLEGTRTKPRGSNSNLHMYEGFNHLSDREKEVFYLLLDGLSSKEISRKLEISPKTADKHRSNIYRKVGVENSTQLLHYAMKLQLVRSDVAV